MNKLSKSLIALGLCCFILFGGISSAVGGVKDASSETQVAIATMPPYRVPPLPYPYNALEPYIDTATMKLHHDKHHEAYVTKLNGAIAKHPELKEVALEDLLKDLKRVPEDVRKVIQNNGGGHFNHTMFWTSMGPKQGGQPKGKLAEAIVQKFGTFQKFQAAFEAAGANRFGSGWVWLVKTQSGGLNIVTTPNQDTPLAEGAIPILGNDLWEHAYYLKYQNRRPEYLKAWWNVVNWPAADIRFNTPLA
jgi:superoxide dismutase, Fe-Mn family